MSSAIRTHAQIPARIKFLLVVADSGIDASANAGPSNNFVTGFTTANPITGSIHTDLDICGGTYGTYTVYDGSGSTELGLGNLYRDLGKQITIVDANKKHLAYFRLARLQNSSANEGVNFANSNVWIKVWSASGAGVAVARTG